MAGTTDTLLLVALVIGAAATVMSARLLHAVIGLAVTSAILTVVMFRLDAPLAGVFELSVCAGLIPAIFLSTISLTQRLGPEAAAARQGEKLRQFWFLPILLVLLAVALSQLAWPALPSLSPVEADARTVLWSRHLDLIAQVVILLGGAFGVVVLIKEVKRG